MIIEELINLAHRTNNNNTRLTILKAARIELATVAKELCPKDPRNGNEIQEVDGLRLLPYVTDNERRLARGGQKLEAVKAYKTRTGASLLESKRMIESEM